MRTALKLPQVLEVMKWALFVSAFVVSYIHFQVSLLLFAAALLCAYLSKLADDAIDVVPWSSVLPFFFLIVALNVMIDHRRVVDFEDAAFRKFLRKDDCVYADTDVTERPSEVGGDIVEVFFLCKKTGEYVSFDIFRGYAEHPNTTFWQRLRM